MADFDYAEAAQDALDLIREFGKTLSISRTSGGTVNLVTGESSGSEVEAGNIDAVELPKLSGVSGEDYLNQYQEDLVRGKLRFLVIAASTAPFEPVSGDEIAMDSQSWEVLFNVPLRPEETSILYKVGIRLK